ncbi:uncharacterized protein A4U43_C07F31120 [Asparagus officinalis]|uniref:KNOX1 domain-containing protein n=1 Tax=Asparagus officinalis TaxID=4686 RepID=A0A5P1EG62_ASPOF|nr:uncharacterized protein A4U43_C07F31120 [Asparagus officinalis]
MEQFSNSRPTAFMYLPSSAQESHPPFYNPNPNPSSLYSSKSEAAASSSQNPHAIRLVSTDDESIKAKIVAHPQYSALLRAYMDCQKVGASPEVAGKLSAIAREIEADEMPAQRTQSLISSWKHIAIFW